jgi:hypothetical protein
MAVYRQSGRLGTRLLETYVHSPYVTTFLRRGWDCRLQLLLVLASAGILGSESRGDRDHIILCQIRDIPNLEGQVPVFISTQERGGPAIPSGTGFPFRRLLRLTGLRWKSVTCQVKMSLKIKVKITLRLAVYRQAP